MSKRVVLLFVGLAWLVFGMVSKQDVVTIGCFTLSTIYIIYADFLETISLMEITVEESPETISQITDSLVEYFAQDNKTKKTK